MQGEHYGPVADALRAGDLESAPVSEAERLLLDFVGTVTRHAYRVTDSQVQALRDAGWDDRQIAEAVYVTGLFNLFVRLADAFDIHPPPERDPDGEVPQAVREGPKS